MASHWRNERVVYACGALGLVCCVSAGRAKAASAEAWPQYQENPFVIKLNLPAPTDSAGGIVVAELNGDGLLDYLVTTHGHVGAYAHDGRELWVRKVAVRVGGSSEREGLPGHHGSGVQAGDVDGDGNTEVLFLTQERVLHVVDGATGKDERTARPPVPEGAERWEHVSIVNLRGKGDRDVVLQATNAKGYRVGRYVAAFAVEKLDGPPLWETDGFGGLAHGPLRPADLDGGGRDEICGYTILRPDGRGTEWRYPPIDKQFAGGASFHIDSLFVADVRPDVPGLEAVLLEEGRNYVGLVNLERGLLWWTTNKRQEPQNAAVGEFDLDRPGLETWCRSRYNKHQKPWVLDSRGKVFATYNMDDVAPSGWTTAGVEVIYTIDWTGKPAQLICAKERHTAGDVAVMEPISGKFVKRFPEKADRLHVADVSGDWREEIIVQAGSELHIHHNPEKNPRPDRPRLWTLPHYRRSKMTYNYYSP